LVVLVIHLKAAETGGHRTVRFVQKLFQGMLSVEEEALTKAGCVGLMVRGDLNFQGVAVLEGVRVIFNIYVFEKLGSFPS